MKRPGERMYRGFIQSLCVSSEPQTTYLGRIDACWTYIVRNIQVPHLKIADDEQNIFASSFFYFLFLFNFPGRSWGHDCSIFFNMAFA